MSYNAQEMLGSGKEEALAPASVEGAHLCRKGANKVCGRRDRCMYIDVPFPFFAQLYPELILVRRPRGYHDYPLTLRGVLSFSDLTGKHVVHSPICISCASCAANFSSFKVELFLSAGGEKIVWLLISPTSAE